MSTTTNPTVQPPVSLWALLQDLADTVPVLRVPAAPATVQPASDEMLLLTLADLLAAIAGETSKWHLVRLMIERDELIRELQARRVRWFRAWRWTRLTRAQWKTAAARGRA